MKRSKVESEIRESSFPLLPLIVGILICALVVGFIVWLSMTSVFGEYWATVGIVSFVVVVILYALGQTTLDWLKSH